MNLVLLIKISKGYAKDLGVLTFAFTLNLKKKMIRCWSWVVKPRFFKRRKMDFHFNLLQRNIVAMHIKYWLWLWWYFQLFCFCFCFCLFVCFLCLFVFFVCLFVCFVCFFVCFFVCLFVSFVRLFVCLFVCFVCAFSLRKFTKPSANKNCPMKCLFTNKSIQNASKTFDVDVFP